MARKTKIDPTARMMSAGNAARLADIANPATADSGKVWTANADGTAQFKLFDGASATANEVSLKSPPSPLVACVGDGTANDTTAFRAILTHAASEGLGVYAPPGTYMLDAGNAMAGLLGVLIRGHSPATTIFKMRASQNADFFTLFGADDSAKGCGLTRLTLDGNKDQNTGTGWSCLHISSVNHMTCFQHLEIRNGYDNLEVSNTSGTYQWVYLFDDLLLMWPKRSNIRGCGTDNMFSNIMCGGSETDSEVVADGANCRFLNFKIMGSKAASGIYITGSRQQWTNIDSQESFMHGVHFAGSAFGIVITNLNCDNNGYNWPDTNSPKLPKAVPNSYGIQVDGTCSRIEVLGYAFSNRNASYKFGVAPFRVASGATNIKIDVVTNVNPAGFSADATAAGVDLCRSEQGHREISGSITLTAADIGSKIINNTSTNITITVPLVSVTPDIKVGKPIDTIIERRGTGTVTLAIGAGGSISSIGGVLTCKQYGRVVLARTPIADDRWFLTGDLGT